MAVTYPPDFHRSKWSLRRQVLSDPLAFLESLAGTDADPRDPGDVVPFSLAGRPAFLLTHPDAIESVLVTHQHKFVKAYGLQRATRLLGHGLLTAEGERHRRQRSVVQPSFHRQRLDGYAKTMVREAERVRDRWRDREAIDVSAEAGALTLSIVGRALFGADVDSFSADVRRAVKVASDSIDPLVSLLAPMRRVRPQRAKLVSVIDNLIAQYRHRPPAEAGDESLIETLIDAQGAGPDVITEELRDDALTILVAGHDTIANALIWTWILLAGRPDIEARIELETDTVLGARSATAADVPALGFTRRVLAGRFGCARPHGSWRGPRWSIMMSVACGFLLMRLS